MSILGSVTTAQGLHYTDNLSPLLESRSNEGHVDEVGNERIRSNEDVRAGNEHGHEEGCEALKECLEAVFVVVVQDGESGKRLTDGIIKSRGNPPHASMAFAQLFQLSWRVLD